MKLTMKPSWKTPMASSTRPARKARTMTTCTGLSAQNCSVRMAIRLVGPMDTCGIVPKNT